MTKKSTENKVIVAGVGMIPFAKPGASETYDIMGAKAAKLALETVVWTIKISKVHLLDMYLETPHQVNALCIMLA